MSPSEIQTDGLTELHILRNWNVSVNVPREELPEFCQALEAVVISREGGYFYWPRYEEGITRCRYDWTLNVTRDRFGARLALVFDINSNDLTSISAALMTARNNQDHVPLLTIRMQNRAISEIKRLIRDAGGVLSGEALKPYYPLFYVQWPTGVSLTTRVSSGALNVYPSVYDANGNKNLSAVAIESNAFSLSHARSLTASPSDQLVALASLILDRSVKAENVKRPRRGGYKDVHLELPTIQDAYPRLRQYRPSHQSALGNDIKLPIKIVLELLGLITSDTTDPLWRSIHAYSSGLDLDGHHPTLASVAYVAALSAFTSSEDCAGTVNCSVHGDRPRHPLISESEAVTNLIASELSLNGSSRNIVSKLLRAVYGRQRSSFVHDAVLRHDELRVGNMEVGRPEVTTTTSDALVFKEELMSLRVLTRRVILAQLSRISDTVNDILSDANQSPLQIQIPLSTKVTISNVAVNLFMVP